MAVKPIPDGYHSVTPYLAVEGADKLLEFVRHAFDADARECMRRPTARSTMPRWRSATRS